MHCQILLTVTYLTALGGLALYKLLCPRLMVNSVYDINIDVLQQIGIRGIIFDLDNTIVPWNSACMAPGVVDWLNGVIASGMKVSLVSNNWQRRVQEIAAQFNIPYVSRAYKPLKWGFRRMTNDMNLAVHEVAVVGDQLFTDVLGGNKMGMYTIWVKPLTTEEFIGTKIHRQLEKLAVRILKSKGLMQ